MKTSDRIPVRFRPHRLRLPLRRLRRLLPSAMLLVCVAPAGIPAVQAGDAIEEPAYREMVHADQLRDAGRGRAALRRYERAERLFLDVQENHPDYKPATIAYRIDYCRGQIERLQSRADAGEPEPDWEARAAEAEASAARWKATAEELTERVRELESTPEDPRIGEQAGQIRSLESDLARSERRIQRLEQQTAEPDRPSRWRRRREQAQDLVPGDGEPAASTPAEPAPEPEPPAAPDEPAIDAEAMLADALEALDQGRARHAQDRLEEILKHDPEARRRGLFRRRWTGGPPEVRLPLARALNAQGRTRAAQALLDRLIEEEPDNAIYLHVRGRLARDGNRHETAAGYFKRAAELEPDSTTYRFDLATALHHARNLDEAAAEYGRILAAQPDHELAHFNRALILVHGDDAQQEEARKHYQRSLELGGDPDTYLERRLNP